MMTMTMTALMLLPGVRVCSMPPLQVPKGWAKALSVEEAAATVVGAIKSGRRHTFRPRILSVIARMPGIAKLVMYAKASKMRADSLKATP
jgi:hypothetical protein